MGERQVVAAAWREFQATKQCNGAHGPSVMGSCEIRHMRAPAWFRGYELGLARGEDRSIMHTLAWLEKINAHNLRCLQAKPAPDVPKAHKGSKRVTGKAAMRKLRAVRRRAKAYAEAG